MSRFVKQGVNPYTKAPIDLLDVDAFARPRPLQRRALILAAGGADSDRGTRLGGRPYLAADEPWPSHDGRPLAHLAQFDFTALARAGFGIEITEGPGGVLAIFIAATDPFISPETAVVATFVPDGAAARLAEPPGEGLVRPAVPLVATAVTETEGGRDGRERPLHKLGGFGDWVQVDSRMYAYFDSRLPMSDPAAVEALERARIEPDSVLGPRAVLGAVSQLEALGLDPMVLGRASADFELLAQIDSDERAGVRWGDVGRLYLFARESDVRARTFQTLVVRADST